MKSMKQPINPNSVEWSIAFNLGYWSAISIYYRGSSACRTEWAQACGARHVAVSLARAALRGMSVTRRRAFSALVKSAFASTGQWRKDLAAA